MPEVDLLLTLRQRVAALALAVVARDHHRTRRSLVAVYRAVHHLRREPFGGEPWVSKYVIDNIVPILAIAGDLLSQAPREVFNEEQVTDSAGRDDGPHLRSLRADGSRLFTTNWATLHVVDSSFERAELRGSDFDEACFERCNFAGADLAGTSWRGTRVVDCVLADTMLVNASFEDARFERCDLQGAKLVASVGVSFAGTTFIRCDLRDTHWRSRQLRGVRLVECKVYGMCGPALLDHVEISGADGSPHGDGSVRWEASDVLHRWQA